MEVFSLPQSTNVNRVIPKNAFDCYTTPKQKQLFINLIQRITWTNKLAPDTVNLDGNEIKEIQIFRIELKLQDEIGQLLEVIDKAIPYPIVFVVTYENKIFLSTSVKHIHPGNEDAAVIDYTFRTDWFLGSENKYIIRLKKSLDDVYRDFCVQLSKNAQLSDAPIEKLVEQLRKIDGLKKEAARLKTAIGNCKQFNKKVELNSKLVSLQKEIQSLEKVQAY